MKRIQMESGGNSKGAEIPNRMDGERKKLQEMEKLLVRGGGGRRKEWEVWFPRLVEAVDREEGIEKSESPSALRKTH
jgi:hypothetical protein